MCPCKINIFFRENERGRVLQAFCHQKPWKLREIAAQAFFCMHWSTQMIDLIRSSGLFRTLYSVAKSEGKSGSSENKQGKGNER